jgi:hypothetical protein
MSCEYVKDLLSAYLDNELTADERGDVHTHLQSCSRCQAILEDYRHFNILLAELPRVHPGPILRYAIFSSPEYFKLTRHMHISSYRSSYHWRVMQVLVAACLLLTLTIGSLIGWTILRQRASVTTGAMTPPDAPQQGPIPAGIRLVFLRDNALWSAPTDGSTAILRLSPPNIAVAAHWAVQPAPYGHLAGDLLAYIDLQHARVHIIRSDGQGDKTLQPPLLKSGTQPSATWSTPSGSTVLSSLSWSQDGTMLAFIADPQGTGRMILYLYSTSSETIRAVSLPISSSISHLAWSPDNVHLAFTVSQGTSTTILDYNTQDHSTRTISNITTSSTARGQQGDTLQSLDWSPAIDTPTLTWSLGSAGHIHSLWTQLADTSGTPGSLAIAQGDYTQAIYTQVGCAGSGCWLLVRAHGNLPGDLLTVNVATGAATALTKGKQVSVAQWSPNGQYINYLDREAGASGTLHIIDTLTGSDTTLASGIISTPPPTWSPDSQQIVYNSGTHILVVNVQNLNKITQPWQLQGVSGPVAWTQIS